jgi:hypothetical protein
MSNYFSSQLAGYHRVHHARTNLLVHILTVPVFLAGTVGLAYAAVFGPWWLAVASVAAMVAAIGVQGRGHAIEAERVAPFRGPADVLARLFAEQWITFPRFVASGQFAREWRDAGSKTAEP